MCSIQKRKLCAQNFYISQQFACIQLPEMKKMKKVKQEMEKTREKKEVEQENENEFEMNFRCFFGNDGSGEKKNFMYKFSR